MEDTLTTLYCLCDDFLSAQGFEDDPQAEMSSAEVMTVALVAATDFGGKIEVSRLFLKGRYFTRVLSKSRFNRRLHALPEEVWQALFALLAGVFQAVFQARSVPSHELRSLPPRREDEPLPTGTGKRSTIDSFWQGFVSVTTFASDAVGCIREKRIADASPASVGISTGCEFTSWSLPPESRSSSSCRREPAMISWPFESSVWNCPKARRSTPSRRKASNSRSSASS